jgi:hypothetical protein
MHTVTDYLNESGGHVLAFPPEKIAKIFYRMHTLI